MPGYSTGWRLGDMGGTRTNIGHRAGISSAGFHSIKYAGCPIFRVDTHLPGLCYVWPRKVLFVY